MPDFAPRDGPSVTGRLSRAATTILPLSGTTGVQSRSGKPITQSRHKSQGGSLAALRRRWNEIKHDECRWWAEVSKEAFNTGLDSLARALANWAASRRGQRAGPPMGFPCFGKRGRGPQSVRFTTGAIRVDADRCHVTLPRVSRARTDASTRVTNTAGRWFCSLTVEIERDVGRDAIPADAGVSPHPVVGVDVGVKTLATVCS